MTTKQEVLQAHLKQWLECSNNRKERGILNRRLSTLLKMHPKSIGRSMRRIQLRTKHHKPKKRGRKRYYGKDVDAALCKIWEELDYSCAENMHSIINEYIDYFKEDNDWKFNYETTNKVKEVSLGTLKLRIASFKKKKGIGRGKSATISSPLKGMIPIRKSHTWKGLPPGYVQVDSVVHCGDRLTGDVVYSVGTVDFATYWSDYSVQWNKGQIATCDSLQTLHKRLPFPLKEIHPDTGNEFINYHMHKWATDENIAMTRSEPYKKNDNMCIEERNGSITRKHLGYVRMDDISLVKTASEIMRIASFLHNHFRPVRRMLNKERVHAKWKRTFEKVAKTPYQRVLEQKKVSNENKEELKKIHDNLNPLHLKKELDILKKKLGRQLQDLKKKREIQ